MTRTEPTLRPFRLRPGFQHYAWGDTEYVPRLYGIDNPQALPFAEVWMGAHPAKPSIALLDDREVALDALVAEAPDRVLGSEVAARFGELPYLLKILAAERPLSIQAHPTRAQAEEGFRRENQAGIPADAPHRNYRDPNHKPELIVALGPFHALCGFRPLEQIADELQRIPEVAELLPAFEPTADRLRDVVAAYLALPDADRNAGLAAAIRRLRVANDAERFRDDTPEHWALVADREHSRPDRPDPGLFFVFLLNLVCLEPGAGLYLPARTPHSYLHGVGIEIMANSDNVIRCGLTPKHVDPAELLRTIDFAGAPAPVVRPTPGGADPTLVFPTPAAEFELRSIELESRTPPLERTALGPETVLVASLADAASVVIRSGSDCLELGPGGVCLVPAGATYALDATGSATVYLATVPHRGP